MIIISMDAWSGLDPAKKKLWIQKCTTEILNTIDIEPQDIIIYINEIDKSNWGQAGITGDSPKWGNF